MYVPVGDEEIEPAIVVDVKQGRTERQPHLTGCGKTILRSDIGKGEAFVAVKRVGLVEVIRDEQVRQSVSIHIASGHPHPCFSNSDSIDRHASQQRFVRKLSRTIIDPQLIMDGVVCHVKINVAIVVEIRGHHSQPTTGGTGNEAGFFRLIGERSVAVVSEEDVVLVFLISRMAA